VAATSVLTSPKFQPAKKFDHLLISCVHCYTYTLEHSTKEDFMKTKVTLTLEDSNWQKLRIYAIQNKTSASAIIDELVAGYLKKSTRRGGKRK
jgi:predicted DNA-binding ribbon-helix-helix protein